jgi:hypothetical protein
VDTIQVVAIVSTALVLGAVLELVRRRRLVERYALLWMLTAIALLVLALLRDDLLNPLAELIGVAEPANLLFLAAFALVFLVLLHFSVAITRLSEETKILAQEVARLSHELRIASGNSDRPGGDAGRATAEVDASAAGAEQSQGEPPVAP